MGLIRQPCQVARTCQTGSRLLGQEFTGLISQQGTPLLPPHRKRRPQQECSNVASTFSEWTDRELNVADRAHHLLGEFRGDLINPVI